MKEIGEEMDEDVIVVRVDGGICSQIEFVAYGYKLQRGGMRVKYDIQWFVDDGKDFYKRQVRNWDVPKAFPDVEIPIATSDEIALAKRRGKYVSGYPTSREDICDIAPYLRERFRPALDVGNCRLLEKIKAGGSCGVHVRRGDLASTFPGYGRPTSVDYFLEAIRIVCSLEGDATFYFFSDDPQWVRENVISKLNGVRAEVCDGNGSDRGYVDLYLLAHCDTVISSVGSLGVYAAILSFKNPRLVMSRHLDDVCRKLPRVIYLNDDVGGDANLVKDVQYRRSGAFKIPYKVVKHLDKSGLREGLSGYLNRVLSRWIRPARWHRSLVSLGCDHEIGIRYESATQGGECLYLTSGLPHSLDELLETVESRCQSGSDNDSVGRALRAGGALVMYKVLCTELESCDVESKLNQLLSSLRRCGAWDFDLVLVCEERCRDRWLVLNSSRAFVRYVRQFCNSEMLDRGEVGDEYGWRMIFDEFRLKRGA